MPDLDFTHFVKNQKKCTICECKCVLSIYISSALKSCAHSHMAVSDNRNTNLSRGYH
jgi:hypothetical protein